MTCRMVKYPQFPVDHNHYFNEFTQNRNPWWNNKSNGRRRICSTPTIWLFFVLYIHVIWFHNIARCTIFIFKCVERERDPPYRGATTFVFFGQNFWEHFSNRTRSTNRSVVFLSQALFVRWAGDVLNSVGHNTTLMCLALSMCANEALSF